MKPAARATSKPAAKRTRRAKAKPTLTPAQQQWLEENRRAIDQYNEFIKQHGLFQDPIWSSDGAV